MTEKGSQKSWEEFITSSNDMELQDECILLYGLIFDVKSFGRIDLSDFREVKAELIRRGYEIHEMPTIKFIKEDKITRGSRSNSVNTEEGRKEMTTEQEKNQISEQATTPEPGASEALEAENKTVQERLADEVKSCVLESRNCEGLGGKLEDIARDLGIGLDELINQVFEIIAGKEEGGYIN